MEDAKIIIPKKDYDQLIKYRSFVGTIVNIMSNNKQETELSAEIEAKIKILLIGNRDKNL